MPHPTRVHCTRCGGHRDRVGPISHAGYCRPCARPALEANHDQLKAHDGPYFDHWRRQCLRAFGVLVLDGTDEHP